MRDYRIVRITPWNETSSRERNNIVDELRYFFFLFLLFVISHLKKREKERNGKRETIDEKEVTYTMWIGIVLDENFSIHNEIDNREL